MLSRDRRRRPDVVIALSVLHWLEDKGRASWRSSATEEAVFEGHDGRLVERERSRQAGFAAVDPVDTSERSRPILLTRKR